MTPKNEIPKLKLDVEIMKAFDELMARIDDYADLKEGMGLMNCYEPEEEEKVEKAYDKIVNKVTEIQGLIF